MHSCLKLICAYNGLLGSEISITDTSVAGANGTLIVSTTSTTGSCPGPSILSADTAAVGSSIGTAVGVSVSVTFVVSFSMGVLMASVLCYISRRSKESSHEPSSHVDSTAGHLVGTNEGDTIEMDTNTAYGSNVSPTIHDEVGSNKNSKGDREEMTRNTAYGTHEQKETLAYYY